MKKESVQLITLLMLSIALQGSLYQSYSLLIGGVTGACLVVNLISAHKMFMQTNRMGKVWMGAAVCCFPSMFFAVDKGEAFLGCLRILIIFMWYIFVLQLEEQARDKMLFLWPYAAAVMSVVGLVSFIIPQIKEWFWQANRYGGFFQYANTCALFLYAGIFVLMSNKAEKGIKKVLIFFIVSLGLYLTGSRFGILLLLASSVYWIVKGNSRKMVAAIQGAFLIIGGCFVLFGGSRQNIGRIYTVFTQNSTMYGRLLYMKDALVMLIKQPLGIGYGGYYWKQGSVQTGVYFTKFIHNDFLQIGLDFGIIFLILILIGLFLQFKDGKQDSYKKALLAIVCGYSFFDFHMQYLSIIMCIVLLLDLESGREAIGKRVMVRENAGIAMMFSLLFFYYGLSLLLADTGKTSLSLFLYSKNTALLEKQLEVETDKEQAVAYAKNILQKNKYSKVAYNALAYASLMDQNYEEAIDYKLQVVMLDRYNAREYQDYLEMAEIIFQYQQDEKELEKNKMQLLQIVKKAQDETSELAWKMKDQPDFSILKDISR